MSDGELRAERAEVPPPDTVASCAFSAFDSLPKRCRPQPHEWTIMAAIIVERNDKLKPTVIAAGTRCLGRRDQRPDGCAVNDSHAEVLARRGFKLQLLQEIAKHLDLCTDGAECRHRDGLLAHGPLHSVPSSAHSTSSAAAAETATATTEASGAAVHPTFRLQDDIRLHLFISDAPCGCAAEVPDAPVTATEATAAHEASSSACSDSPAQGGGRRTGAKVAKASEVSVASSSAGLLSEGTGVSVPPWYSLRTKSGRSDLPPDRRTQSMCCSDKLAKWCRVGIQGALLCHWLDRPIGLSSITIAFEGWQGRTLVSSTAGTTLGGADADGEKASRLHAVATRLHAALLLRSRKAGCAAAAAWGSAAGSAAGPLPPSPVLQVTAANFAYGKWMKSQTTTAVATLLPAKRTHQQMVDGEGGGREAPVASAVVPAVVPAGLAFVTVLDSRGKESLLEVHVGTTGLKQGTGKGTLRLDVTCSTSAAAIAAHADADRLRSTVSSCKWCLGRRFEATWRATQAAAGHTSYFHAKHCEHGYVPAYRDAVAAFHADTDSSAAAAPAAAAAAAAAADTPDDVDGCCFSVSAGWLQGDPALEGFPVHSEQAVPPSTRQTAGEVDKQA